MFTGLLPVWGQDLSQIGKVDPVKVSGSLSATTIAYTPIGIAARRDPFSWFTAGTVNISVYGWSLPFSFSYSNQERAFRQPFNRMGLTPQYKWVKAYIGYHNLSFSSYTLAGHLFAGGGLELTPANFRVTAMYGRLNKAVPADSAENGQIPTYERWGYGLKAGYAGEEGNLDLILFKAWDRINSLAFLPPETEVLPADNLTLGVVFKKPLGERLTLEGEYARSALNRDSRTETIRLSANRFYNATGGLFTPKASAQFFDAFNLAVGYNAPLYSLQMRYERVDPEYTTLGAYFFNNDLENITLNPSVRLLKSRLTLSVNAGVQRNNLDEARLSTTRRVVGAATVSYTPASNWNLNGSYSNFSTFTNIRPTVDPFFRNELDTLNFYQLSQSASFSSAYSFGPKERKQGLSLSASYQTARDADGGSGPENYSRFYNGNLAHRYGLTGPDLSLTSSLNVNRSQSISVQTLAIGPGLSLQKGFLEKKLRTGLSASLSRLTTTSLVTTSLATERQQTRNQVLNARLNGSYTLQEKHAFSANMVFLRRFVSQGSTRAFSEFTATINYSYSF